MKVVTFGVILLRLVAPCYLRFSQSAGLSATFQGRRGQFRIPVYLINCLPENDLGQAFLMDLSKWFKAGAYCVGMGSQLFPNSVLKNGDFGFITATCNKCLAIVQ